MRYVALLRGIMPMNPNMRGEKLRSVFEKLGFTNVATVIASGNVVFESPNKNSAALEAKIEKAFPKYLGFTSTTIIRSHDELAAIVKKNPFKGKEHSQSSYLLVTFLKDKHRVPGGAMFTAINLKDKNTPNIMTDLERRYTKAITSRTWLTVLRILKKMESRIGANT